MSLLAFFLRLERKRFFANFQKPVAVSFVSLPASPECSLRALRVSFPFCGAIVTPIADPIAVPIIAPMTILSRVDFFFFGCSSSFDIGVSVRRESSELGRCPVPSVPCIIHGFCKADQVYLNRTREGNFFRDFVCDAFRHSWHFSVVDLVFIHYYAHFTAG